MAEKQHKKTQHGAPEKKKGPKGKKSWWKEMPWWGWVLVAGGLMALWLIVSKGRGAAPATASGSATSQSPQPFVFQSSGNNSQANLGILEGQVLADLANKKYTRGKRRASPMSIVVNVSTPTPSVTENNTQPATSIATTTPTVTATGTTTTTPVYRQVPTVPHNCEGGVWDYATNSCQPTLLSRAPTYNPGGTIQGLHFTIPGYKGSSFAAVPTSSNGSTKIYTATGGIPVQTSANSFPTHAQVNELATIQSTPMTSITHMGQGQMAQLIEKQLGSKIGQTVSGSGSHLSVTGYTGSGHVTYDGHQYTVEIQNGVTQGIKGLGATGAGVG